MKKIDWEQRRYEIAREVMASQTALNLMTEDAAAFAVSYAEALIKELRMGMERYMPPE